MNEQNDIVSKNEINKVILHLNCSNRRMFFALLAVCLTAIVLSIGTILIFVRSYGDREKNWQNTIRELMANRTPVVEVIDDGKTED